METLTITKKGQDGTLWIYEVLETREVFWSVYEDISFLPEKHKLHWKDHLNKMVHVYNCTPNQMTAYSPFFSPGNPQMWGYG